MSAVQPRLSIRQISKNYAGIHALRGVEFDIAPGEIHALVGENGAGKSTLVKITTGIESADSGQILLDGTECRFRGPMDAREHGVVAVYQDAKLFPNLDIAENIFMGVHPRTRAGFVDRKLMYRKTRDVLEHLGADLDPRTLVVSLSIGQMLFVQFARAMFDAREKLLLLDEPTAALSPNEADQIFGVVRRLRERGVSILYISHRLEELASFADRITILRDGAQVLTDDMSSVSQPEIVRYMVGRAQNDVSAERRSTESADRDSSDAVLRVADLTSEGEFAGISFAVRAGEIVGMAGLVGSGRTEIAKALFGALPISAGKVWISGEEVAIRDPAQMIGQGVVYVPEDREKEGLIGQLSVIDNMLLPAVVKFARMGFVDERKEMETFAEYSARFQIKAAGPHAGISSLSGGNRQKVVLAKWMAMRPKVFIFDEPTQGIDVGSKAQVHSVINNLAEQGLGILVISSDLPEILKICDRMLVISDGALVAEFPRESATQENIMTAAVRGKKRTNVEAPSGEGGVPVARNFSVKDQFREQNNG
jgi:rhamnose transport system ATP-binding protein